ILALTIVASMQAVGIILVVAMLISPGITAYLLTRSFSRMITLAILFSVISSVIGTFISFHIDGATGPSIVLTQAVFFIIALLCNQIKLAKIKRQTKPANA
ncbi:TPA: metal ABC transporter permease, partial [Proteus mirabilis]